MAQDRPLKSENIEFTGRLRTSVDPSQLGKGEFQSLTNYRYTDAGIESVRGITKVNASPVSKPTIAAAIHFVKDDPSESHVLVQGMSGGTSALYDSTDAVPGAATFTNIFDESANSVKGSFSLAPDGCVAYGNGQDLVIWAGAEARCSAFMVSDKNGSYQNDPTILMDYTSNIADNDTGTYAIISQRYVHVASVRRLNGAKFYIGTANTTSVGVAVSYWNGSWTPVSNLVDGTAVGGKTLAQTGTISFDDQTDASVRFFNNITAYWYLFDFGATVTTSGSFTPTSITTASGVPGYPLGIWAYVTATGHGLTNFDTISVSGALPSKFNTASTNLIYIVDADHFYYYVPNLKLTDFTTVQPTISKGSFSSTSTVDATTTVYRTTVSNPVQSITDIWDGVPRTIDAFQVLNLSNNQYQDMSVNVFARDYVDGAASTYASLSGSFTVYAGFTERMSGLSFDIVPGYVNTATSLISVSYWNGSDWTGVSENDGTLANNATFNQSGTVFWTPPSSSLEFQRSIGTKDLFYYYRVQLSVGTGATITPVGINTGYLGYAIRAHVHAPAHGLANGTKISVQGATPASFNVNTATVYTYETDYFWYYAPGLKYPDSTTVQPTISIYANGSPSAAVRIDRVTGIPASKNIGDYKIPAMFQNRLVLCNNQSDEANTILIGGANTSCVFGGSDSTKLYFGDDREIVSAVPFFSRFSNAFFENLLVGKTDSVWIVDGTSPDTYKAYKISGMYGLAAPKTMTPCDLGFAGVAGTNAARNVVIWQSSSAIVMWEGSIVFPIDQDITDVFDQTKSYALEPTMTSQSEAFFDEKLKEWHWLWASKGSSTLNMEYVFDVMRKKWFTIDRGTGKRIQLGFPLIDSNNNRYVYGATTDGYLERLEYGQTFDGNSITCVNQTGDIPLGGWMYTSQVRKVKPIFKKKSTTTNTMQLDYYGDTDTTPKATIPYAVSNTTGRLVQRVESISKGDYTFHSFKMTMTTNNEDKTFEPIGIGILYKEIREDLK